MRNNSFYELEKIVKDITVLSNDINNNWQDDIGSDLSGYLSSVAEKTDDMCDDAAYCLRQMSDCEDLCKEILGMGDGGGEDQKVLVKRR